MQKLQQNQSIEQKIYIKSRLIYNLQHQLLGNQKKKECYKQSHSKDDDLLLKEQYQIKLNGLQNKPLHKLVVLYNNQQKN